MTTIGGGTSGIWIRLILFSSSHPSKYDGQSFIVAGASVKDLLSSSINQKNQQRKTWGRLKSIEEAFPLFVTWYKRRTNIDHIDRLHLLLVIVSQKCTIQTSLSHCQSITCLNAVHHRKCSFYRSGSHRYR